MNAIDQLMQSFGAAPSPAMAGLLGLSPSASSESSAQFLEALQGLQSASDVTALNTSVDGQSVDSTKEPYELLASLGITLPTEAGDLPAEFNLAAAISGKYESAPDALNIAAGNGQLNDRGLSLLASLNELQAASTSAHGEAVPVLSQKALEELGFKLEQLPALPTGEELAATAQAGLSSNSHIIPTKGVDGLLSAAPQQSTAETIPETAVLVETVGNTGAGALNTADGTDTSTAPVTDETADIVGSASNPVGPEVKATEQPTSDAPVSLASELEAANAAKAAEGLAAEQEAQAASDPSQDGQEGHAAATMQQAAASKKAGQPTSSNSKSGPQKIDASAAKPHDAATSDTVNRGEQDTLPAKENIPSQSADKQSSRGTVQAAPSRETQAPLTPERLAGHSDTAAIHSVASGLSSMRGESSFLSGMSLLGGKTTPELAHQVGQQLNVSVSKAMKNGQQEFTVRLNPKELGSVRVELSFLKDGHVQAKVMAERPETLDLLQRDVRSLEKTFEASGHKSDGGIQFSLDTNDQESAGRAFAEAMQQEKMRDELAARNGTGNAPGNFMPSETEEEIVPLEDILPNVSVDTGLDIRV